MEQRPPHQESHSICPPHQLKKSDDDEASLQKGGRWVESFFADYQAWDEAGKLKRAPERTQTGFSCKGRSSVPASDVPE